MKRANLVRDEDNPRACIHDPTGEGEGQSHAYGGVDDPNDVDDVVA